MDVSLRGYFTTRSPLSHIGESIQTTSYLVQEPILQPDGTIEEVFCYSGNAWRGQLRDLAACYLLDKLGAPRVSLDTFHLLFSGGRIGGEQSVNLEVARAYRRHLPLVALWGGGVGNQILPGKMRVGNSYPVCREAAPVLRHTAIDDATPSYRGLTTEKSFSRKDDAKDERLTHRVALPETTQQATLLDEEGAPKPATKRDGPADQMRMTSELLIAGVRLETTIDLADVSEVELGCLLSALVAFARLPYIGGQANKGHGLVDLTYHLVDLATGDDAPFITVRQGAPDMSERAGLALRAYDRHLTELYDAMLSESSGEIRRVLAIA